MCVNASCALERAGSRRVLEVMSCSTAVVSGGIGQSNLLVQDKKGKKDSMELKVPVFILIKPG